MSAPLKFDAFLDIRIVRDNPFCEQILEIIQLAKPGWCKGERPEDNLESKVLAGGLANHLIAYCEKGNFQNDALVVKIYGQGMEIMVNRQVENRNMLMLHEHGLCPPLYVIFNNGIAYGYTPGVVLNEDSVRQDKVTRYLIREIVRLHKVRPAGQCEVSEMWELMYKLLHNAPDSFTDPSKQKRYKECIKSKSDLQKEIDELKAHLETLQSPVVFCHNDLLLGNIIYDEDNERVSFIDFEFAWPNYEHFELANHFCEYAGVVEMNYERYPAEDYQREWVRLYLLEKLSSSEDKTLDSETNIQTMVSEKDVESHMVKIRKFTLASHLLWNLCCLCRANDADLDFDYLGYGIKRFQEYFRMKDALFALKVPE